MNQLLEEQVLGQYFDGLRRQNAALAGTLVTTAPVAPAAAAESVQLGAELGIPSGVVIGSPEVFRNRAAQQRATTALTGAPITADWVRDATNAALAQDDLDNLTALERWTGPLGRAVGRGIRALPAVPQAMIANEAARQLPDIGRSLEDLTAEELNRAGGDNATPQARVLALQTAQRRFEIVQNANPAEIIRQGGTALQQARAILDRAATVPMSETAAQFRDETLANADNGLLGALKAFAQNPIGGMAFVAETAAESLPILAAATATTALTRSPAAGLVAMTGGGFLQENSQSAMAFLEERGVDLSTPESAMLILQDADLMREAQQRGLTRGLVVALFDAASGGVAGKTLMRSPAGEVVVQGIAQTIFGSGGELAAQYTSGQDIDWRDVVVEGLAEMAAAPVEIGGVLGRAFLRDTARNEVSGQTATALQQLDEAVARTHLRDRAPALFSDFLNQVGLGEQLIYVPAADLREYFQAKDLVLEDGLANYGLDRDVFAELEASGGDVAIPATVYASKISGTEDAPWFHQNATFTVDEMSMSEAQRFNAEMRDTMEKALDEADRQREFEAETRASDVQVYDTVYSQLREAGRTVDVAQNEARVWQAFWRTMGERYGEDPLDLARQMGVDIRGPQNAAVPRRRGQLDIALNALRSQGAPKATGRSLLDFVADQGGIRDVGGDLGAMDVPNGVIAETRAQAQERIASPSMFGGATGKGIGLDEMGRRAIEAGYFPELMGGADIQADGTRLDEAAVMLKAIQREMSGERLYRQGEGPDAALTALAGELSRRGVDLSSASNDEAAAALERAVDGTQLSQDTGAKRGSIVLPTGGLESGQTVINLFEQADLSTFLHESGHFFLEAFSALASSPEAPQSMKDDLAAIHKFLGVDGTAALNVQQHETWARGFEAYLFEGRAPSLELADAFARFKSWLVRIYRSIAGLNVKLTPEIREVMDRMLATDAQIAASREAQQMSPLFTDQKAAGMSDAAWNTYQRMARRSVEQANQTLLEATMAKVKREREAWWRAERKQVRAEVTATVNSQREYRLIEMLANQRWIGKEDAIPDLQLDRKELVDTFGAGVLAEISRTRLGGKRAIYGDNGQSLRETAEFFGFKNPSEMIEVLQNAGKRQDAIERETDRIMTDRYGDPLTDGSIEEEALAAIHSEQQATTVAAEARHLAGRAGLPTRNLTARVFRQRAKMMLGRMAVREATRPDAFLAAERKAAKRAEDAFARIASGRDPKEALSIAARHKEQQLLNHYLYLESRDLTKMVEAKREAMRAYGKASVRAKLDGGYIEQIDALLEAYDFRVRSQRQIQRSEGLKQFVDRMTADGRAGELNIDERLLDQAKKTHYSRLSVDELQGLFDTIENIDHLGRFKKKLQDAKDARDMDEVVSSILGEFNANVSGTPPSRTKNAGEDRRTLMRDYLNTVLNADTLLREIDGFKDLGPTWTALKDRIDAGMYRLVDRRRSMAEAFDKIYSVYSAKEQRDMAVKKHNPHLGDTFSKFDLLALALNTGNQDNFERLTNPKTPRHHSQGAVEAALAELDARDWQTVQNIWDYIDSYWPEIAAKEKRQTGVSPKKVEAKLMVSAPGFVTGGYYPIKYDNRLSGLADDFQQKELADALMGGAFGKAQTRNGHTKARTTTTRQPVMLDLAVAHSHVEQVIYDLEIGEAAAASWKILHDGRIRSAFTDKGKKSDFDALEIWLQDVAAGERIAAGGLQTMMRHVRSGFTISRLAFNLSTAMIQPSGIVQSAVVIGKKEVAKGYIDYMSHPQRWVREVTAISPMMRERETTFERDIFNVVGAMEDGPVTGRWAKFHRDVIMPWAFYMMQKVQFYTVDMPTWVSAYQKEIGLSGDEGKARSYADLMVKRAQGSGFNSDLGMLQRGTVSRNSRQQELPRMMTALGSYMFAKFNVAYERARQTDFKNPAQVFGLITDTVLLFTLEATLYAAVKGGLPGEDEDEPEDWAAWLAKQTAFGFMSTLPLSREFAGALQGFGGGGVFGSAFSTLARPLQQAGQGEVDKSLVKSFIDAGAVMLHLPASQTKAILDAFFEDDMAVRNPIEPGKALGFGTGPGRSIADLMFGD